MAKKEFVWLYKRLENAMTKDDKSDYIAKVIITASMTNADIARKVVERGTVFDYSTLLNAFELHDQVIRDFLGEGYSVVTGVAQYQPAITGVFHGTTFDPKVNKCMANINPSVELRRVLETVRTEYSGDTQDTGGAEITSFRDATTGLTDGTITPGGIFHVYGKKIKVVKEDGTTTGSIFFLDAEGKVSSGVLTALGDNDPGHISFIAPQLEAGTYTLRINTMYSQSGILLKDYRSIFSPMPITVK